MQGVCAIRPEGTHCLSPWPDCARGDLPCDCPAKKRCRACQSASRNRFFWPTSRGAGASKAPDGASEVPALGGLHGCGMSGKCAQRPLVFSTIVDAAAFGPKEMTHEAQEKTNRPCVLRKAPFMIHATGMAATSKEHPTSGEVLSAV